MIQNREYILVYVYVCGYNEVVTKRSKEKRGRDA